jgi:hypothetical protein
LFLVTAVAATPLVAFLAWRYNLTFKGVLRDPEDVVVRRDTVARSNSPTRRSTHRQDTAVGVVLAYVSGSFSRNSSSVGIFARTYA